MNCRAMAGLGVALGLLLLAVARAEPPEQAKIEVSYLLGYVEGSGCEFYRNGTWHDSRRAAAHLRRKYDALVARGLIETAEDFIDRAATESSISGVAYQVRCGGREAVETNPWLREVLVRYRAPVAGDPVRNARRTGS